MPKTEKALRLLKAVKLDGKWRSCPQALAAKGIPTPELVLVGRQRESPRVGKQGLC
jgi:hypothetical protein